MSIRDTMMTATITCPACEGSGSINPSGREYPCGLCDGDGRLGVEWADGDAHVRHPIPSNFSTWRDGYEDCRLTPDDVLDRAEAERCRARPRRWRVAEIGAHWHSHVQLTRNRDPKMAAAYRLTRRAWFAAKKAGRIVARQLGRAS